MAQEVIGRVVSELGKRAREIRYLTVTTSASCLCMRPFWVWTVSSFDSASRWASRASTSSSWRCEILLERSSGVTLATLCASSSRRAFRAEKGSGR